MCLYIKEHRVHDHGERKVSKKKLCASGEGQWSRREKEKGGREQGTCLLADKELKCEPG